MAILIVFIILSNLFWVFLFIYKQNKIREYREEMGIANTMKKSYKRLHESERDWAYTLLQRAIEAESKYQELTNKNT